MPITMTKSDQLKRRLRLRDLDTFLAVAACGGMRKAAQRLYISQPAVSKGIADIESELGVRLLNRSPAGVELTDYGHALHRHSVAIFDDLRRATDEIAFLADPSGGQLSIGCSETVSAGLAPAIIARLFQLRPRLVFNVESGDAPVLLSRFLRERTCELVIARPYGPVESDLEAVPLFHERMTVVVGPRHRFAARRKMSLAELAQEPWLLSRNETMRGSPATVAFERAGLELPPVRIVTGSLNLRYSLLATGRFVTIVPHSLLKFGAQRGTFKLLPVELPSWEQATCIVTLKGRTPSPVARSFIDVARELTKAL